MDHVVSLLTSPSAYHPPSLSSSSSTSYFFFFSSSISYFSFFLSSSSSYADWGLVSYAGPYRHAQRGEQDHAAVLAVPPWGATRLHYTLRNARQGSKLHQELIKRAHTMMVVEVVVVVVVSSDYASPPFFGRQDHAPQCGTCPALLLHTTLLCINFDLWDCTCCHTLFIFTVDATPTLKCHASSSWSKAMIFSLLFSIMYTIVGLARPCPPLHPLLLLNCLPTHQRHNIPLCVCIYSRYYDWMCNELCLY